MAAHIAQKVEVAVAQLKDEGLGRCAKEEGSLTMECLSLESPVGLGVRQASGVSSGFEISHVRGDNDHVWSQRARAILEQKCTKSEESTNDSAEKGKTMSKLSTIFLGLILVFAALLPFIHALLVAILM